MLAFAVVTQTRRFQDAGQELRVDHRRVALTFDRGMRRTRNAASNKSDLLEKAILADRHGAPRRCDRPPGGKRFKRRSRHVLELRRDGRAHVGEARQPLAIEIRGPQMLLGNSPGRARRIGVEHGDRVAASLRRVREHASELATAKDPERRARRDEGRRHPLCSTHFRSADIARAASVCRARNASSLPRKDSSAVASMATAKSAALAAPALPMAKVATGMPRGIWTME